MHHLRKRLAVTALVTGFCLAACSSNSSSKPSTNSPSNATGTTAPATSTASATSTAAGTPTSSATATASGTPAPSSSAISGAAQIAINNFAYSPATLTVAPGATVTVVNHDTTAHTVTGSTGGNPFDTGSIAPGATGTFKAPTTPGTYPYFCTFHSFMLGTLIVHS